MSSLKEQMHKNLYRSYFRGQRPDYSEELSIFKDVKFYTTRPLYALYYAGKDGVVSEYRLKSEVNIFNAKSKADIFKLHKYINDNHLNIPYKALEDLKTEDWISALHGVDRRETILGIIKFLGYDGFFNYEYSKKYVDHLHNREPNEKYYEPGTLNNPAIGIFDNKDVFIHIKDYHNPEELFKFDSVLDFKEDEIKNIKSKFRGLRYDKGVDEAYKEMKSTLNDYLTVSQYEVLNILDELYNERWSKKEEMLLWYNIFKSGERPGYKEAAEKIKKELENFQE